MKFKSTGRLAEGVIGRLMANHATDLSDAELHRVLSPCVGGLPLVKAAIAMRDRGMLTGFSPQAPEPYQEPVDCDYFRANP